MSDISKCFGTLCDLKKSCYRYTADDHPYRQSYFAIVPFNVETQECEYFWDNKEYESGKTSRK